MDKNRLWAIGSGLVMVVVLVLGWIVGIQPQLTGIAVANDQRISVEQTNAGHEALLGKLKKDYAGIGALNEKLASLSRSVPSGTNVPDYVDQLDALAQANNVTLKGLTVDDAVAYAPVVPVAVATAEPPGEESPAATETPAPAAAPGSPPVADASITADSFASLSVQITVSGTYSNVLKFVNGLQTGQRLFLVTGLTTNAATDVSATGGSGAAANTETVPDATPAGEAIVDGSISGLIYSILTPATQLAATGG